MTPEGKIKQLVNKGLADLIQEGIVWKFMPVQNGMGIPGLDFFLCVAGRWVAIETKTKGKKLTPRQEQTKAAIEKARGLVFVVDDAQTCAAVMQTIRGLAGWGMDNVACPSRFLPRPADGAGPRWWSNQMLPPAED